MGMQIYHHKKIQEYHAKCKGKAAAPRVSQQAVPCIMRPLLRNSRMFRKEEERGEAASIFKPLHRHRVSDRIPIQPVEKFISFHAL